MLYLDSAASYPMLPEVKTSMKQAFDTMYANPSSNHLFGETVFSEVQRVREQIADAIGAYPSEIIFTSGATESNNLALKGLLFSSSFPVHKKHIVISAVEHKCVLAICGFLSKQGFEVSLVKPASDGSVSLAEVKELVREDTGLISIMHVNNELGTINNLKEIGEFCYENSIIFHTDAAQSFCKVDIDVDDFNIDSMSLSAHKIGGPKGIGALYVRELRSREVEPVLHGAGQEFGLRGGTIPAPLIIGFGTAITHYSKYYNKIQSFEFKKKLLKQLDISGIEYVLNGSDNALPHCVSITIPHVNVSRLLGDNEDICFAQGSACSSKEIEASHVLTAIGITRELADKTFRLSVDHNFNEKNLEQLVNSIKKAID